VHGSTDPFLSLPDQGPERNALRPQAPGSRPLVVLEDRSNLRRLSERRGEVTSALTHLGSEQPDLATSDRIVDHADRGREGFEGFGEQPGLLARRAQPNE
jgi:hypothetical protein